ncbi:MAG: discoidin domain-containing protein, partial [Kiritimatiellae bacterium]|nr:discoidin domain-containing protein [Kiritimatiellia bacterium]
MFVPVLAAALALLTDNPKGQAFPDEVRRIHTGATVVWDEKGSCAGDKEILKTRIEAKTPFRSRILNGRLYGDGDCCVWGAWNGARKAAFTIDLKEPYLVSKVTLWSSENQSFRGIAGYTVALGSDGTNFTEVARRSVPADFDGGFGKDVHPVPFDCELEKPAVARYVRVLVGRHPGR